MHIFFGLLVVLAVNALPFWGVFGWKLDPAQLLVLFWVENAANTVLISARILIHRRLSRKRGHWDVPANFTVLVNGKVTRAATTRGSALVAFLVPSGIFTLAHGAFVVILAQWMLPEGASLFSDEIRLGIEALLAAMLLGFVSDLVGIRERPFAWIRHIYEMALGRVVAIQLLIFGGIFTMAVVGDSQIVLVAILALKLLADLGSALPPAKTREKPPWYSRFLGRLRPSFDEAWIRQHREEVAAHARDEEIWEDRRRG